jgi:predicted transcriptional regulator
MIRTALVAALLAGLSAQDDEITKKVKALAEQLQADDVAAADEAVGELVKLGEAALPAIKALAAKASGDTKLKLEEAAGQIEKNLRRGKAMGKALTVTIKADQKPVAAVLEDLKKQSGQPLVFKDLPAKTLTVALENRPFWEALDAVCKAHGGVMWKVKENEIIVAKGAYRDVPKVFRGNLVYFLDSFTVMHWMGQGGGANVDLLGKLAWIKGARPLSTSFEIEKIEDDKGTNLRSADGGGFFVLSEEDYDGGQPPSPDRLSEPLQFNDQIPPHEEAEKIAVVSGRLTVKYALDWKKVLSLAKPADARGQTHQAGDVTVAIQDFAVEGRRVRMKVAVTMKGEVEEDLPVRARDFVITDTDGKSHPASGSQENWESFSDNNGEKTIITYALTVQLPEKAQIAAFELLQPTEVEEVVIPFEFKDLGIK